MGRSITKFFKFNCLVNSHVTCFFQAVYAQLPSISFLYCGSFISKYDIPHHEPDSLVVDCFAYCLCENGLLMVLLHVRYPLKTKGVSALVIYTYNPDCH